MLTEHDGAAVRVSGEHHTAAARVETAVAQRVSLHAPGRLHLGFLDPSGTLGRQFGSLGLVVDGFETELALSAAPRDAVSATAEVAPGDVERAAAHLHALRQRTGLRQPLHLALRRTLPAHAGFGSGTQLALAVGRAFVQFHAAASARLGAADRLKVDSPTLAQWLGRGLRSGVGIAGFDQGGLLVDGGPAADGSPAPVLARLSFPAAWRVLVVLDAGRRGLSGSDEKAAIASLPPLPRSAAADICHQVLMRVLPGAASADFGPFAQGVSRIQQVLGEHFAPAQNGSAFTSAAVGRLLGWAASSTPATTTSAGTGFDGFGIGQSSWGPTGFALCESQAAAEALVAAARAAGVVDAALELRIVGGRNHGATCTHTD